MAYCEEKDILIGDTTPVDGIVTKHVNQAAEEIDAMIGHLYTTPVVTGATHTMLLLKNINTKLATGRYFAAMNRGNEGEVNVYAMSLIKEAMGEIQRIASGQIILRGAETPATNDPTIDDSRAPTLIQADTESGVKEFYGFVQTPALTPIVRPITEWDDNR